MMLNLKKFVAFLLMVAMFLSLAGCQKEEEKEEDKVRPWLKNV